MESIYIGLEKVEILYVLIPIQREEKHIFIKVKKEPCFTNLT